MQMKKSQTHGKKREQLTSKLCQIWHLISAEFGTSFMPNLAPHCCRIWHLISAEFGTLVHFVRVEFWQGSFTD